MTIDLSTIVFENDFFSLPLPSGDTLVLNKIDEDLKDGSNEAKINHITLLIIDAVTEENIICSSVIGFSNPYFTLTSNYKEYLGTTLNKDNKDFCYLEVNDE